MATRAWPCHPSGRRFVALSTTSALVLVSAAFSQDVIVTRIDGTTLQGVWFGADRHAIRVRGAEGGGIRADELESIEFTGVMPSEVPAGTVFHLDDGGTIAGEIVRAGTDAIVAKATLGDAIELPFGSLAAVRLAGRESHAKAAEIFAAAMEARLPGKDVLITRDVEDVKTVQGRLESLGPTEGSFFFGDRVRPFQTEKMFGIVFAAGPPRQDSAANALTVFTADGASFSGELIDATAESVNVAASFGKPVRVSIDRIVRMDFRSPRVVYLSDLTPTSERTEGRLHEPWPVRLDRNAANGPLSLDGRVFDRGLGTHSKTELRYALDRKFETFVATVGIDDAVRPRGSVVFRVLGDGKDLFESEAVTGTDPGKRVSVDVRGVKELTLISDYGDDVDLSDYADWAGARLIK